MIICIILMFDYLLLCYFEHLCFEVQGAHDGLKLILIVGIHGCEYSLIVVVICFMREFDIGELFGLIMCVLIVSLEFFK